MGAQSHTGNLNQDLYSVSEVAHGPVIYAWCSCPKMVGKEVPRSSCARRVIDGYACAAECDEADKVRTQLGLPIPKRKAPGPQMSPTERKNLARRVAAEKRRAALLSWRESHPCQCGAPSMERRYLQGRKPICAKCSTLARSKQQYRRKTGK